MAYFTNIDLSNDDDFNELAMLILLSKNNPIVVPMIENKLNIGYDIDKTDVNGNTLLILACQYCETKVSIDVIRLLLEYGADPNITKNGRRSLVAATAYNDVYNEYCVQLLLKYGTNISHLDTSLMLAVENDSYNGVKALLKCGADPNYKDSEQCTILGVAIGKSSLDIIKLLLENDADANGKSSYHNLTPIMVAATSYRRDNINIMNILLKYGANINATSKYDSVLVCACVSGPIRSFEFLIDAGACVEEDKYNMCKYNRSIQQKFSHIIKLKRFFKYYTGLTIHRNYISQFSKMLFLLHLSKTNNFPFPYDITLHNIVPCLFY